MSDSQPTQHDSQPPDIGPGLQMPRPRKIQPAAVFSWIARAWDDMGGTGFRGVFYGGVFAMMGLLITVVYATHWQLTMGLTAGFFLIGPFVCTGIYELSRQRERGERVDLFATLTCWRRNLGGVAFFAAILTFAMIVWARVSIVLFALFSTTDFPSLQSIIGQIVSLDNLEFLLVWTGVGFVFASLVFAVSVVAIPLLIDRRIDTMMSIFTSVRVLYTNPGPMYLWAALIVLFIGASMLAYMWPLVITAPLIGHASWHAYRDLVEPEGSDG
jgi:uncharacterized membrane protein